MLVYVTEVEKLRQQVVTEIRTNQELENDLNMMDIKIGLLVKNRITLQVNVFLLAVDECVLTEVLMHFPS